MVTAIVILHILVSILIIAMVLLQSGKGAAIGSTFGGGGSQTLFGSSGPTSMLTKVTAACAIIFMVTSIYLTILSKKTGTTSIMSSVPAVSTPVKEPVKEQKAAPVMEKKKSDKVAAPDALKSKKNPDPKK